jgi:hypothetical protein
MHSCTHVQYSYKNGKLHHLRKSMLVRAAETIGIDAEGIIGCRILTKLGWTARPLVAGFGRYRGRNSYSQHPLQVVAPECLWEGPPLEDTKRHFITAACGSFAVKRGHSSNTCYPTLRSRHAEVARTGQSVRAGAHSFGCAHKPPT